MLKILEGTQEVNILIIGSILIGELFDSFSRPRLFPRHYKSFLFRFLSVLIFSSSFLTLSGSVWGALLLSALCVGILVVSSNIKMRILNEPLVFTDLTLISSIFRYPSFYIKAVPIVVRMAMFLAVCGLIGVLIKLSTLDVTIRLEAIGVAICATVILAYLLEKHSRIDGPSPALWEDVRCLGLLPVLLLYTCRWLRLAPLCEHKILSKRPGTPESIIIVQCESFADPIDIRKQCSPLPSLVRCQKEAWKWGKVRPSGFGAYTMRSEYGVLCGDSDATLSYRYFDPFLSASQSASHSLAYKLQNIYHERIFVHPYDLRFYGRRELMPCLGFTDLVGRESFSNLDYEGPHIGDAALTRYLLTLIREKERFLAYCVTIENHGPWGKGRLGQSSAAEAWYEHVKHSDEMLGKIYDGIKKSGKDILLVFFGDHRPALNVVSTDKKVDRSTPYVILRPNSSLSSFPAGHGSEDFTPAELHQEILNSFFQ